MLSRIEKTVCSTLRKRKNYRGMSASQIMAVLWAKGYEGIDLSLTNYVLTSLEGKRIITHYENTQTLPRFEKYYFLAKKDLTK